MGNQRCRGTRDLLPQDMSRFRYIEEIFRNHCLKWGYEEVRTPTLEYLHLFTATGTLTPNMLGRVYSFLDWDGWSGERVVLRPDGTIPIARLYIDNLEKQDLPKLFYVANVFAFEETGAETRERWQCGVELIGGDKPLADVELITLAWDILQSLELAGVELRLSHMGLLRALLKELQLEPDEEARLLGQILDGDGKAFSNIKTEDSELESFFSLLSGLQGSSSGFLKNLKAISSQRLSGLKPSLDDFIGVAELLDALECPYQIDVTSSRGFEYYTGVIFQFLVNRERVASGGRYDDLIPLMGSKSIPASGFALYVDRLMPLIKPEPGRRLYKESILVRTEASVPRTVRMCFDLARALHKAEHEVKLDLRSGAAAKHRWSILVRSQSPSFVVVDEARHKKYEKGSIGEVLSLVEGKGAHKASST